MKQTILCVLSVVSFATLPMKQVRQYRKPPKVNLYEHEDSKYYHEERKSLFNLIKLYEDDSCKKLIKKHENLAETKCEFGDDNITIDHYPITYLLSLETKENNKKKEKTYRLQKTNIMDAILENTGAPVLRATLSYILCHITAGFFTVNDITLVALEKILARKNSILSMLLKNNGQITVLNKKDFHECKEKQKTALNLDIQFLGEIDTALRFYEHRTETMTTQEKQCYNLLCKHYQEQQK